MSKPKREEQHLPPADLNPSALRYYRQAHEGAKRDFSNLRYESEALERIARRNAGFLKGLELSPLETPHGEGGPLQDAIKELQGRWVSARGWPSAAPRGAAEGIGTDWADDPEGYMACVDALEALLSRVLGAFEPLRFPRRQVDPKTGLIRRQKAGSRSRLPAAVHREARRLFEALNHPLSEASTQADGLDALASAGLHAMAPLGDEHLASVVALACIADALEELSTWESSASADRLDAIVARAHRWALEARRWLDRWDHEASLRERATAERSQAASLAARTGAKRQKDGTLQAVARALEGLPSSQQGSGAASVIAERLGFSVRTVRRHMRDARALVAERRT